MEVKNSSTTGDQASPKAFHDPENQRHLEEMIRENL
jgi:hypothetical protein